MNPNYKNAAAKAYETFTKFGSSDPQRILRLLSNVLLVSFESSGMQINQDAFTCVKEEKYIIFYNAGLNATQLRSALARELGHVILQHDGKDPEDIWLEEATCFAYHFLCPSPASCIEIKYRPDLSSISMSFKSMQVFPSITALKKAIAEEHTRAARYVGLSHKSYSPDDVEICNLNEKDIFGHWNNYSAVMVDGKAVGYCGQ